MSAQSRWLHLDLRHTVANAGHVTDALTNSPIAGATVKVIEGPPEFQTILAIFSQDPDWKDLPERLDRTVTRADGIFVLKDLPPGEYRLRVTAPPPRGRYSTFETDPATPLTVWAEDERDEAGRIRFDSLDIILSPTRIEGQITQAGNGEPLGKARVRLRGDTVYVATDADGRYALTHVAAGSPRIEASAPGMVTAASEPVALTPGEEHTVDLALETDTS